MDEGMDPEMSAAMGFSSFGQQLGANKRKRIGQGSSPGKESPSRGRDETEPKNRRLHPTPTGSNITPIGDVTERRNRRPEPGSVTEHPLPFHHVPPQNDVKSGHDVERQPRISKLDNALHELDGVEPLPSGPEGKTLDQLTRDDLQALRRGVPDARGDLAYFMPSFVEDPWTKGTSK
ncbi:hypothetical protein EJ06DRAFT_332104 [Trichodelitschia bisporula]|uniref:Uncharacterized protein n=1 Tax=Trichodelitschia bisporula TaxID=703511 RepID=A0A6G1I284_9PEZI|nr:hypothetical protein EJ06DRAFT_332104 [Trichodelitschia bisporula]